MGAGRSDIKVPGMEVFTTVLGIGSTICAIVFGYIAFRRNSKSVDTAEWKKDGVPTGIEDETYFAEV